MPEEPMRPYARTLLVPSAWDELPDDSPLRRLRGDESQQNRGLLRDQDQVDGPALMAVRMRRRTGLREGEGKRLRKSRGAHPNGKCATDKWYPEGYEPEQHYTQVRLNKNAPQTMVV